MKRLIKGIIIILGTLIVAGIIVLGIFFYIMNCRITKVDEFYHQDYSIVFEEIGEPFLFGSAKGRITVKDQNHIIHREKMDVANDGARIGKHNWKVIWNDDYVLVYIFQDEGFTIEYTFYYNPSIETKKIINEPDQIIHPKPSTNYDIVENDELDKIDENNLLEIEESQEMILIAKYLQYNQYDLKMDAKGNIVLVSDSMQIKKNIDHEYVVFSNNQIIGFYLVKEHQVIDEKKTNW